MSSHPVLIVLAIAVAAPLLAEARIGVRVPAVVLEMLLGMLVGPHLLGLVSAEGLVEWLGGTAGLAALFFMAGLELDLGRVRGRPLSLAAQGWILSFGLALAVAALLSVLRAVQAPLMIALALATTALGVLLPMLLDAGELDSEFGRLVLAAGAVGEFVPVVVMSLLLTGKYSSWMEISLMLVFVAIVLTAGLIALGVRPPRALELLARTMHASSQLPVRLSVLLVVAAVVLSEQFGFEIVPGAFAAGMVIGLASRDAAGQPLRQKIVAVCFGFFVPFFFVTSGIKFDLTALLRNTTSMMLVPLFLGFFLLVRGLPVLIYRDALARDERLPFALYSATALPIVIAIAEFGVRTGRLPTDIAAALVGAAMLSVLLFPAVAGALRARPAATRVGSRQSAVGSK